MNCTETVVARPPNLWSVHRVIITLTMESSVDFGELMNLGGVKKGKKAGSKRTKGSKAGKKAGSKAGKKAKSSRSSRSSKAGGAKVAYCLHCRKKHAIVGPIVTKRTKKGSKYNQGKCSKCGGKVAVFLSQA